VYSWKWTILPGRWLTNQCAGGLADISISKLLEVLFPRILNTAHELTYTNTGGKLNSLSSGK